MNILSWCRLLREIYLAPPRGYRLVMHVMFNVQSQPKALNKKPSKTCNNRHNTILLHDVGGTWMPEWRLAYCGLSLITHKYMQQQCMLILETHEEQKGIKIGAKDERFKHILHNYTSNNASKRQQIIYTSSLGAVLNAAAEQLRVGGVKVTTTSLCDCYHGLYVTRFLKLQFIRLQVIFLIFAFR